MMMALERTTRAFAFQSPLSLAQMKQKLDVALQRPWLSGDSEWHGDYLGGSASPGAVARIYATNVSHRFHVDLRFVAEAVSPDGREEFLRAESILLRTVLPVIEAHDVEPSLPLG